jgi:hypothetical protein
MTEPKLARVCRDGVALTDAMPENDAFAWLLHHQGQSVDWACKYEGYSIEPVILPVGTRCGIHGEPTHTGRCSACDAERHVRPEETMTDRPATLRQVEAANALEWAGE